MTLCVHVKFVYTVLMSRFTDMLLVSPFPDGKHWIIQKDFGYDIGAEGSGDTINVPIGFSTDFASVPRPLWWLLAPWGVYGNAAVIHDYLYNMGLRPKLQCDKIFLEAMKVLKTPRWQQLVLFHGVLIFGWFPWLKKRYLAKK